MARKQIDPDKKVPFVSMTLSSLSPKRIVLPIDELRLRRKIKNLILNGEKITLQRVDFSSNEYENLENLT